ncbi:hypothetical protein K474DRAFT_1679502 [Panus rudis PR-1116 ss-1]|nr:hypothetical protein K474DRAFT_1679502 [Panus rudis PR-1116 ss-1]
MDCGTRAKFLKELSQLEPPPHDDEEFRDWCGIAANVLMQREEAASSSGLIEGTVRFDAFVSHVAPFCDLHRLGPLDIPRLWLGVPRDQEVSDYRLVLVKVFFYLKEGILPQRLHIKGEQHSDACYIHCDLVRLIQAQPGAGKEMEGVEMYSPSFDSWVSPPSSLRLYRGEGILLKRKGVITMPQLSKVKRSIAPVLFLGYPLYALHRKALEKEKHEEDADGSHPSKRLRLSGFGSRETPIFLDDDTEMGDKQNPIVL